MWSQKSSGVKKGIDGLVAVAIDKDKYSQYALRWAAENLVSRGGTLVLIHVLHKSPHSAGNHSASELGAAASKVVDRHIRDLFVTFRCFCTRKDIQCFDVMLEDTDVAKALTEYVSYAAIENLVVGVGSRNGFMRKFKTTDIPSCISRSAPDFCTVYIISKGKISAVRNSSRPAPHTSPIYDHIEKPTNRYSNAIDPKHSASLRVTEKSPFKPQLMMDDREPNKSPFNGGRALSRRSGDELSETDTDISYTDISFVSSGRPSTEQMSPSMYDYMDSGLNSARLSSSTDQSFGSVRFGTNMTDPSSMQDFSFASQDSARTSCSSRNMDDMEAEMHRLKLELKQTMNMYNTACKAALTAKQTAEELQRWRTEEERRLEKARMAEESATAIVEEEKAKCKAALQDIEANQKVAEMEVKRRMTAEMKAHKDAEEMKKVLDSLGQRNIRYRKYTIKEIETATESFSESHKIGEGGYGPVYKCHLDHTPVAVKVLRPDAAQGRSQFQQEVEVLSCIRHPHMVLLLGACPEYGCLVYEYMANGSLDDCLFRRGNALPLSWQHRFRIAAEIGTGLLFLHQAKPEPLVHRDLKPANILLDQNYVSKIGDVGLARLVPPSIADDVTQFRMTSTAGTFCYIDPEYQQTGMLGTKSDVYSLGIMFLQLVTAKPAMGLTHHVERAIENGTFTEFLDQEVPDWPVEETLGFAKMALQCAELRRKDRPDLATVVLPELNRLRALAEAEMKPVTPGGSRGPTPSHSLASTSQDVISDPAVVNSGYASSKSRSGTSPLSGKESQAIEG